MPTTNGYATVAELEALVGVDFSAKFIDAAGSIVAISDTVLEARGSMIEGFMIGLMHITYTSSTIPADVKSYFLKAWELDTEEYLAARNIFFLPLPESKWEEFLNSKFSTVIEDESNENAITDFIGASDYR